MRRFLSFGQAARRRMASTPYNRTDRLSQDCRKVASQRCGRRVAEHGRSRGGSNELAVLEGLLQMAAYRSCISTTF